MMINADDDGDADDDDDDDDDDYSVLLLSFSLLHSLLLSLTLSYA